MLHALSRCRSDVEDLLFERAITGPPLGLGARRLDVP